MQDADRISFLFKHVDPFICKQVGHLTFHLRSRRKTKLTISISAHCHVNTHVV